MFLFDVNVLVALAWHRHAAHDRAHRWFTRNRAGGWATCPITQCALIRLSCNPIISGVPCTPEAAREILRGVIAEPGHVFWPDDLPPVDMPTAGLRGHNQMTDAYLVALARHHGGRLATLDGGGGDAAGGRRGRRGDPVGGRCRGGGPRLPSLHREPWRTLRRQR